MNSNIKTPLSDMINWSTSGLWWVVKIVPIGKPRMTQRDKWKKRGCVQKYYAFKDELRKMLLENVQFNLTISMVSWIAYFPFPKSYSAKKRESLSGMPMQQKPDRDNIDKAILDSLFDDDSNVAIGFTAKLWDDGNGARIEVLVK